VYGDQDISIQRILASTWVSTLHVGMVIWKHIYLVIIDKDTLGSVQNLFNTEWTSLFCNLGDGVWHFIVSPIFSWFWFYFWRGLPPSTLPIMALTRMKFHLSFKQGKFIEKCFMKFHLSKFRFQLLDGRFKDLLPYFRLVQHILLSKSRVIIQIT